MRKKLQCIILNFTNNLIESIQRFEKSEKNLLLLFGIKNKNSTCKITNITSTNSDPHKGGRQVLVLDVDIIVGNEEKKRNEKLVYKPSNLLPDLLIFGNTEVYNEVYLEGKKIQSFVELVNDKLEQEENKLKTYKILPYEINDPSNSYGFMEYLSYDYDFDEIDYFKEASQIINELKKKQFNEKNFEEEKKETKLLLSELLHKKFEKYTNNTIINNEQWTFEIFFEQKNKKLQEKVIKSVSIKEEELKKIPKKCGMLAAIAVLCGVKDLHFENAIISKNNFFIIDTDVSFQSEVTDLNETELFFSVGAMSDCNEGMISRNHYYLNHPILQQVIITKKMRNKLLAIENNKIEFYRLDKNNLFEGFSDVCNIIIKHKNDFIQWFKFHETLLMNMYVRVLPASTENFRSVLESYLYTDLGDNDFFNKNNTYLDALVSPLISYIKEVIRNDEIPFFCTKIGDINKDIYLVEKNKKEKIELLSEMNEIDEKDEDISPIEKPIEKKGEMQSLISQRIKFIESLNEEKEQQLLKKVEKTLKIENKTIEKKKLNNNFDLLQKK